MSNWTRPLGYLVLAFLLVGFVSAQAPKPDKDKTDKPAGDVTKEAAPKTPTHKVEKGPFKIETSLKGVLEAGEMTEVTLSALEAWTPQTGGMLLVKKAVEHGTPVRKGEPVIWLDLEKIDRAINDLETDQKLAELALKLAEEELPVLEKAAPLELATLERAKKIAEEDLKKFLSEDRSWSEKSANFMVKRYQQFLEYEKEELRQLQKMYKAKELTEETEEIILKRQRNAIEEIEFMVKMAEYRREQLFKSDLPRREQQLTDGALKLDLDFLKAKTVAPLLLNQKRLALTKMKYEHEKATTRLAKLKRDRETLTVKAPADGIVYHGKCVRGQWQPGRTDRLQRGSMLQGEEVLATVVKARPVFVRAVVEEKELRHVRPGLNGKVTPASFPDLKLAAKIEKLSAIPVTPGNFEARVAVELGKEAEALMPGMACTVKLIPYVKANALTVPAASVFTDDLDDDKRYVYLPGKDGKPEKRYITTGMRTDRKVEVLEGLKEGDEILQEKPGDGKKIDAPRKEDKQ